MLVKQRDRGQSAGRRQFQFDRLAGSKTSRGNVPACRGDRAGLQPSHRPWRGALDRGTSRLLAQPLLDVFFRFLDRWDLEVRVEAMNAPNATHFGDPGTSCSVVGAACLGSFGQVRSAFGQRIVQLGAVLLRF
jgi:hypothetical protein